MFTGKNEAVSKVTWANLVRLSLIGWFKKETLTPTETHDPRLRLTEPPRRVSTDEGFGWRSGRITVSNINLTLPVLLLLSLEFSRNVKILSITVA